MSDFKKLRVWEKARELATAVYRVTQHFPQHEQYGLTSQMRRAAVSVGSNIAEGCGRAAEPEKARFFRIAAGSLSELEFQTIIARDLRYVEQSGADDLASRIEELGRMLGALTNRIKAA